MNHNVCDEPEAITIPPFAADAWAAVYIDVAEKLDAEEHPASVATRRATVGDVPASEASPARMDA